MKPNEILALKKERAKYKKQADALKATLTKQIKQANVLSKEELDSAYDPDDPTSTQRAIDAHNKKVQELIDKAIAEVDEDTEKFLATEYSDDKIELTTQIAQYNEANNTKLTYEDLTENLPPKFMKKFKEGEYENTEALLKDANEYLSKVGGVYDPTPPKTPEGTPAPAPDVEVDPETGEEELY